MGDTIHNEMTVKARVLLIDAEQVTRETMQPELISAGYAVDCAEDGATACEMAKAAFYDIILVDYKLPDMNGLQVIKEIMTISRESVPVIISNTSSIEVAVESMRIGAHDYLIKPVAINDLLVILNTITQEREAFISGKENKEQVIRQLAKVPPPPDIITISMINTPVTAKAVKKTFQTAAIISQIKKYFFPQQ